MSLNLEDFRRLGVRPNECRLTVIRQAATRSSRPLAEHQLRDPSDSGALQLSRVATSAYRLLDPRQRRDSIQRAHVGRILPAVLAGAAATGFESTGNRRGRASEPEFDPHRLSDAQLVEMLELDAPLIGDQPAWTATLQDDDLLRKGPMARRWSRAGRRGLRTWGPVAVAASVTAAVTWFALDRLRPAGDPAGRIVAAAPLPLKTPAATAPTDRSIGQPETILGQPSPAQPTVASVDADADKTAEESLHVEAADPLSDSVDAALVDFNLSPQPTDKPSVTPSEPVPSSDGPLATPDNGKPDTVAASTAQVPMKASESTAAGDAKIVFQELDDPFLPDPFAVLEQDEQPVPVPLGMSQLSDQDALPMQPDVEPPDLWQRPDPVQIDAARRRIVSRLPGLSDPLLPTEAATRIARLESLIETLTLGSSDHWVANLMMVEAAWLAEDVWPVRQRTAAWLGQDGVAIDQLLASSFVSASDHATTESARRHAIRNGLILAEQLLLNESVDDCDQVIVAVREIGEVIDDEETVAHVEQFERSLIQMRRQAEATGRVKLIDDAEEPQAGGDAGIAGRYYCLMLRRWQTGLPWLVETSDPRVSNLARSELASTDASADALVTLAGRWLTQASRETGRTSDSMKLHAIELLKIATEQLSGIRKLEAERQIDQVASELPFFAVEATVRPEGVR